MQIQEIINHIAAGDSIAAKESIENVLSAKAFDALQGRKQEMAATLFGGQEQEYEEIADDEEAYAEDVEHDGEQLDEVSFSTATKVYQKRAAGRAEGDTRNRYAETDVAQQERSKKIIGSRFGTKGKVMTRKVDSSHDNYTDTEHLSGSKRKENFAKKQ
jgi:hypothetical protein